MRFLYLGLISATVWTSLAVGGAAGTIRDDRPAQLYLDLAQDQRFDSVGRMEVRRQSGAMTASGTLIAREIMLTAAHVIDRVSEIIVTLGGVDYRASRWMAHPDWNGDLARGADLALVQLTAPAAVQPAVRYRGDDEIGRIATAVGFGKTGTGLTGTTIHDGKKRAGMNVIDTVFANVIENPRILMQDFDNPHAQTDNVFGSPLSLDLEFLAAAGDSGGGLFVDSPVGPALVGIHSFGAATDGQNNADYGDRSGHTRVSVFNDWIDSIEALWAPATFDVATMGEPMMIPLIVPEPSGGVLLLLGAGGLCWKCRSVRRFRRLVG